MISLGLIVALTFIVGRLWAVENRRNREWIALAVGLVMVLALGYGVLHPGEQALTASGALAAAAAALFVGLIYRIFR